MKKVVKKKAPRVKKVDGTTVDDLQQLREEILLEAESRASRKSLRVLTPFVESFLLPQKVVKQIADEVATRISRRRAGESVSTQEKIVDSLFLDTSAILDERFFALVKLGVFVGNMVLLEGVLSEIKHIADLKDDIKKERGKRALKELEELKKSNGIKLSILKDEGASPVDDKLVEYAKKHTGRIVTCDFNLTKKARISGVVAIDIHEVANALKTQAIPGEVFWVKVIQAGKGENQGVGYLPDGTMIVVEQGKELTGKTIQVEISRIIQTEAGKILFSKILPS